VEPKIVNGPELLTKWVGGAEEKVRELFKDAEAEQSMYGDDSQLHVIVLDEMDAICKERGSCKDGTGVSDNIVNQMLAKMDGVNSVNNILLIGMTNRKDMIDRGLLRSGRFEVQVEVSLPDEAGRVEILNIHTAKMRESGLLEGDVSLREIASRTRNFTGADLEGLVKSATSCAVSRKVDVKNISNCAGFEEIRVTGMDFEHALAEVQPTLGQDSSSFESCIEHGIVSYSDEFKAVSRKCVSAVEQARNSDSACLLSLLLVGPPGCGKTAMAAHVAKIADFPFARRIASEDYVGKTEHEKIHKIAQTFDDAQKSPLSLVVLDDLERLVDYACIGPRFSNAILQLLFRSLKRRPAKTGHRMLIVATTSEPDFIRTSKLQRAFTITLQMPVLSQLSHYQAVLDGWSCFTTSSIQELCGHLRGWSVGIRLLLQAVEMAIQRSTSPQQPLSADLTLECLRDAGVFDCEPDFCVLSH
jgi:vesicle-fusing ATPase